MTIEEIEKTERERERETERDVEKREISDMNNYTCISKEATIPARTALLMHSMQQYEYANRYQTMQLQLPP